MSHTKMSGVQASSVQYLPQLSGCLNCESFLWGRPPSSHPLVPGYSTVKCSDHLPEWIWNLLFGLCLYSKHQEIKQHTKWREVEDRWMDPGHLCPFTLHINEINASGMHPDPILHLERCFSWKSGLKHIWIKKKFFFKTSICKTFLQLLTWTPTWFL